MVLERNSTTVDNLRIIYARIRKIIKVELGIWLIWTSCIKFLDQLSNNIEKCQILDNLII